MKTVVRTIVLVALSASLDVGLAQTASSAWKDRSDHQWSNRWEGADLPMPVAARPLELVSFLAAPNRPAFSVGDQLTVSFYLDRPRDVIRPYAREIRVIRHYWMEPKWEDLRPGWNHWGPWPTQEVLARLSIAVENVGVLVRLDDRHPMDGRVAPVVLRTTVSAPIIERYDAVLLAGTAFARGEFEVRSGCGSGTDERIIDGLIGQQRTGSGVRVSFELPSRPAGDHELTVSMTRIGSQVGGEALVPSSPTTDVRRYCFYHQPDPQAR